MEAMWIHFITMYVLPETKTQKYIVGVFRQHAASIYGFVRQLVAFHSSKKKFRTLLSKVGG